jgi:plastocyanin
MLLWVRAHAFPLTLVLLNLTVAGCAGSSGGTPTTTVEGMAHGDAQEKQASGTDKAAPAAPNQVVIDNFTYSPATLTVAAGTKVTWVNHDDVPHTVTSTNKPRMLDSPSLDTDDKFTFEFKKPGTYDYFCAVHPKMTGKIIVK